MCSHEWQRTVCWMSLEDCIIEKELRVFREFLLRVLVAESELFEKLWRSTRNHRLKIYNLGLGIYPNPSPFRIYYIIHFKYNNVMMIVRLLARKFTKSWTGRISVRKGNNKWEKRRSYQREELDIKKYPPTSKKEKKEIIDVSLLLFRSGLISILVLRWARIEDEQCVIIMS